MNEGAKWEENMDVHEKCGLAWPMETVHRHSLHPDGISQQNRLIE